MAEDFPVPWAPGVRVLLGEEAQKVKHLAGRHVRDVRLLLGRVGRAIR